MLFVVLDTLPEGVGASALVLLQRTLRVVVVGDDSCSNARSESWSLGTTGT